jgi:hypothetical protein
LRVSSFKNESKCLCLEIPESLLLLEVVSGGRILPKIGVAVVVVDVVTRAVAAAGYDDPYDDDDDSPAAAAAPGPLRLLVHENIFSTNYFRCPTLCAGHSSPKPLFFHCRVVIFCVDVVKQNFRLSEARRTDVRQDSQYTAETPQRSITFSLATPRTKTVSRQTENLHSTSLRPPATMEMRHMDFVATHPATEGLSLSLSRGLAVTKFS